MALADSAPAVSNHRLVQ